MLPLDSSRWADLEHAYGEAEDIPRALQQVLTADEAALDELFGSICHQGSTYSASYAAVPHLVIAAGRISDPELRAQALSLVGEIACSSDYRGDAPPDDIRRWYEASLPRALELALDTLKHRIDTSTAIYLLKAAAALQGYVTEGRVLSGFADEEFPATCPGCSRDLYVSPHGASLRVAAEDPVSRPATPRTDVVPGTSAACDWLLEAAASPSLADVRALLPCLYGVANCPACNARFSLIEQLG